MRVYLDNCCYNRPFDPQTQVDVRVESASKLGVQLLMFLGKVEFAWSEVLDYEILRSPQLDRTKLILPWRERAAAMIALEESVIARGEEIQRHGIKEIDALHIACASEAACDWFLTTDKGILKKIKVLGVMRIANPVEFVTEGYQWRQ